MLEVVLEVAPARSCMLEVAGLAKKKSMVGLLIC